MGSLLTLHPFYTTYRFHRAVQSGSIGILDAGCSSCCGALHQVGIMEEVDPTNTNIAQRSLEDECSISVAQVLSAFCECVVDFRKYEYVGLYVSDSEAEQK